MMRDEKTLDQMMRDEKTWDENDQGKKSLGMKMMRDENDQG